MWCSTTIILTARVASPKIVTGLPHVECYRVNHISESLSTRMTRSAALAAEAQGSRSLRQNSEALRRPRRGDRDCTATGGTPLYYRSLVIRVHDVDFRLMGTIGVGYIMPKLYLQSASSIRKLWQLCPHRRSVAVLSVFATDTLVVAECEAACRETRPET